MENPDQRELTTYLKYCSDNEAVIKGIFIEHKIRFSQPWVLNDPLEFNPTIKFKDNGHNYKWFLYDGVIFPSEEYRLRHRLIEPQINAYGILSLIKIPDSFDMWSRYANGHKGFMIELNDNFNENPCMKSKSGKVYPVKEVDYVDEYAINIDDFVDGHGSIQQEALREQMFYTKISRWRDEKEYRMVRPFTDKEDYKPISDKAHRDSEMYLFDFSLDCIATITFGATMSNENKMLITKACKNTSIKFLQAVIVRDEKDEFGKIGNIILIPVDTFPNFYDMAPFSFTLDMSYVKNQEEKVTISSLSELPYWEHEKEWVNQLYEIRKAKKEGNG